MTTRHQLLRWILVCGVVFVASQQAAAESPFEEQVAPILARRCFSCHNDHDQKGDFSLETAEHALDNGLIEPGDPDGSHLLELITPNKVGKAEMPKSSDPLSKAEQAIIRRWIADGADWPKEIRLAAPEVSDTDWWSLHPIARPTVPEPRVNDNKWVRTPIDAFIIAKLRQENLAPSPRADRRTLLRRLYFDLIGLPPSPKDLDAYLADKDPAAYEKVVDRLLASPRYGERWARHWLDVVHYGDTHGYDKDKLRPNAWPYRDYVIRAFNDDTPYGRFVKEQLAGDVLYPQQPHLIAATGFIVAGPWDFIGHVEVPASKRDGRVARNLDRDDMVTNTIQTFNSMTVGCARCHNHKFDPITQEDYYSLQAVFAAIGRNDRTFDASSLDRDQRRELAQQRTLLERRHAEVAKQLAELANVRGMQASPSNGYHSHFSSSPDVTKWVQIDVGAQHRIERIDLIPARPTDWADTPGFGFPVRYKLELSDQPGFAKSQMVAEFTKTDVANPGDGRVSFKVGGKSSRYVRLTATKLWDRGGRSHALALAEMRVYGAGRNLAEGASVAASDSIDHARWHTKFLIDGFSSRAELPKGKGPDLSPPTAQRDVLTPALTRELAELGLALKKNAASIGALQKPQAVYAAATNFSSIGGHHPSGGKPLPIYVLKRGVIDDHLDLVGPGTLRLPGGTGGQFELPPDHSEGDRRIALANWIADKQNPLTWRSIVNRIWQYHFGRGIVDSPNDFGRMGSQPTHPELLDWLAVEFRDGGQSIKRPQSFKQLHKLIVMSSVYQQSTAHHERYSKLDGGNRFLWRANRRRLEAEAIRDAVLMMAGKLDLKMYGPGFRDFVIEQPNHSPQFNFERHNPDDTASHRRSVYRFLPRSQPQPFMQVLDCADPSQQVAKRDETLTALSALAMLNNRFMIRMSEHFARRLEAEDDDRQLQLEAAFRLAFGRAATTDEIEAFDKHAHEYGLPSACHVILNLNEFVFVD